MWYGETGSFGQNSRWSGQKPELSQMTDRTDLKILRITVQAQAATKLRDAILNGVFKPGQRLTEANLCRMMGVSRTSVREALRQLEAERLITITPNRGPSVTEVSWEEARQIYEVRALLESEAVRLFTSRGSAAQLASLKLALQKFESAARAHRPLQQLTSTQEFYEIILDGCGNRIICELIQGLTARITFLRARSMSQPGRTKQSAIELRRIYETIRAGNPDAAQAAAVHHVRSAAAAARDVFGAGKTQPRLARRKARTAKRA
jgi:DNA-binding GntR family transcriptional regulator